MRPPSSAPDAARAAYSCRARRRSSWRPPSTCGRRRSVGRRRARPRRARLDRSWASSESVGGGVYDPADRGLEPGGPSAVRGRTLQGRLLEQALSQRRSRRLGHGRSPGLSKIRSRCVFTVWEGVRRGRRATSFVEEPDAMCRRSSISRGESGKSAFFRVERVLQEALGVSQMDGRLALDGHPRGSRTRSSEGTSLRRKPDAPARIASEIWSRRVLLIQEDHPGLRSLLPNSRGSLQLVPRPGSAALMKTTSGRDQAATAIASPALTPLRRPRSSDVMVSSERRRARSVDRRR